ncbi:MAG: YfhO family protein [Bacteroides sp.]|nr:YfhO family protein [Bacteroides sp.]
MMKKTYIYSFLAALLLAVVALLFFFPDDIEGNVLQQHDTMQGIANGQEGKAFTEATGETTRWTNSLFSGMPNFQIAPSYPANTILSWVAKAYSLWLPAPANLLFIMMVGFFIMCLCFRMKWYTSLFASIAWGFSTYFIIIIGAGHIWKFATLAYIPPTIGGIMLCYRGKYLPGTALTALFAALQLHSNHPQMTYYFCFVIAFLVLAWLWKAFKKRNLRTWCFATLCCLLAGGFAVAANSASLYNSYEYSKETVRGKSTDLTVANGDSNAGMDRDAITAWSYGTGETFSLLIPNVKGGATIRPEAGQNTLLSLDHTSKADDLTLSPQERQFLGQFPQYFGDQPMTNGPVYVGAFVLLLAILALFVVDGAVKWALFGVSILAILLSWGHNFPAFTNFFIDSFPGYNKFRAVASILVIVEFTVPLLAAMGLRKMLETPDFFIKNKWTVITVFGGGAAICLIGWISPSIFGNGFSEREIEQLSSAGVFNDPQYASIIGAIRATRLSLVSTDCLRSLLFILLGSGVMMLWIKGIVRNKAVLTCCLTAVVLIDLFSVNKRYVSSDSFTVPSSNEVAFKKTAADDAILQDKSNYRVMDLGGFMEARSSYFHKTIGGYHAAKLTRYNDLITHQISKGNPAVLNMLNAKYILDGDRYEVNPDALGNAWIVNGVTYVDTPDSEMKALDTIRPGRYAVADKVFESIIGNASAKAPDDTIYETSYAPNKLTYKSHSSKDNVAVFSEIYFPWGWTATVDGKVTPIGRVNYVLRAIRVPAGDHEIVFTFDPQSLKTTNTIAIISVIIIFLTCLAAVGMWYKKL